MPRWHPSLIQIVAAIPVLLTAHCLLRSAPRLSKVPKGSERVLVLGASSGVGRSVAHLYAGRGAKVCLVGRRAAKLDEVVKECRDLGHKNLNGGDGLEPRVVGVVADFSDVDDMVRVRSKLENEWGGIDTLIVVAGISALQPLMAIAGVEFEHKGQPMSQATSQGIQRTVDIATKATAMNYVGPLVAAVTFIPLLHNTSSSPAILLLNSVASLIPAPTRTLYASTKSASLLLYQALAIEHPSIAFTFFLPGTIEGDFRAGAVDGGTVLEIDPNKIGLKRGDVAKRMVRSIDWGEKSVWMPKIYRWGHFMYWLIPRFMEWRARVKYNFEV